ncbi:MAG: tRNA dihydrouridine(16) synthase DusC [Methylococcaceae bacterium]|nr:tRNA dihydrouridine(16) synthase DusC [Methylococcaceae bacterium]
MRILLAPMEGLLDHSLRGLLTAVGGLDACVTEFVRVSGNLLPRRLFHRVAPELGQGGRTAAGVPVRVQLLGSDPEFMAMNAARLATLRPAAIDLNFGCPAKTVNRHHGGASLLRDPEGLGRVVEAVRRAVPAALPVTAKMRLGYADKSLALDCAQAIAGGGAAELVVHARTKEEGYRPPAHWEWIGRIQSAVAVPVIANGEIWTVQDYRRCREVSGVADVMLGRGMVASPALARMIRQDAEGLADWDVEVLPALLRYWLDIRRRVQPRHQAGRIKQWLAYLRRTYPQAESAFLSVRPVTDPELLGRLLFPAGLR